MERIVGLAGLLFFLGLAFLLSRNRKAIRWSAVGWGLAIQCLFALMVLKWAVGQRVISFVAGWVTALIGFADRGGQFVFGDLAGSDSQTMVFAFKVLPIVIFISSFFTCLYHLGIMQRVVLFMAWLMKRVMGVSGAESLAAAANVFMGQTEAPLVVAPYVPSMTYSELMALMTGGMATVSGAVLGGYVSLGIRPDYLISASIMAAPASLVMAKLLVPETEVPKTSGFLRIDVERPDVNLIAAAARGASQGAVLAINIAAMLIAFIGLIFLTNGVLGYLGELIGTSALAGEELSLQLLLSYLLAPVAILMGVPMSDAWDIGRLIGTKIVLNEFIAYIDLVQLRSTLGGKSELIATYALCGFANLGSIGIQIGGIGGLAPDRKADLAKLGLRALVGGSLASFMTATIAGLLS